MQVEELQDVACRGASGRRTRNRTSLPSPFYAAPGDFVVSTGGHRYTARGASMVCAPPATPHRHRMTPKNLLLIMSDEHNPKVLGAAGHPVIHTPNLDALARHGTRFTSAYTTCPICVPARAAFAVGKYVHQIGFWDNADGYD